MFRKTALFGTDLLLTASNNSSPPLAGTLTQRLLRLWPYFRSAKTGIALAAISTLIFVLVAINQPFTIWMLRGFVAAVPKELEDAAALDGFLLRIALKDASIQTGGEQSQLLTGETLGELARSLPPGTKFLPPYFPPETQAKLDALKHGPKK